MPRTAHEPLRVGLVPSVKRILCVQSCMLFVQVHQPDASTMVYHRHGKSYMMNMVREELRLSWPQLNFFENSEKVGGVIRYAAVSFIATSIILVCAGIVASIWALRFYV